MANIIELKIALEYFEAQQSGNKNFEIRQNDRDYQPGQYLWLREYDHGYTGRSVTVEITYMTDYMQQDGYVVLGTKII